MRLAFVNDMFSLFRISRTQRVAYTRDFFKCCHFCTRDFSTKTIPTFWYSRYQTLVLAIPAYGIDATSTWSCVYHTMVSRRLSRNYPHSPPQGGGGGWLLKRGCAYFDTPSCYSSRRCVSPGDHAPVKLFRVRRSRRGRQSVR